MNQFSKSSWQFFRVTFRSHNYFLVIERLVMRSGILPELFKLAGLTYSLKVFDEADGHIMEGALLSDDNTWFPIERGVPCFLDGIMRPDWADFAKRHNLPCSSGGRYASREDQGEQAKTTVSFSDKWKRFKSYGLEMSHQNFLQEWYCKKLGLPDTESLKSFYADRDLILECGPGSGFNARFMAENCRGHVVAADISEAAHTTFENTKGIENCHVIQADLMNLPFSDDTFDFIIADGVLHHTPDTKKAVNALYRKVKPGGQFFFYVYRKMGAARQFCDQYIRTAFMKLEPEECYKACEGLTELGREISRLNATIKLENGVDVLGIPPGEHDVQRILYYNFVKCFWNDAFDFETNNMVNFDWYHPHNAWQHTEEEVKGWLDELGVIDCTFNPSNPNGISVLLRKPDTL